MHKTVIQEMIVAAITPLFQELQRIRTDLRVLEMRFEEGEKHRLIAILEEVEDDGE